LPDQNFSSEKRVKDLISRLMLEEKATLMCYVSDTILRLCKKNQQVERGFA